MKKCNKCEVETELNGFYKDAGMPDGRAGVCKKCKNKKTEEWRERNRDKYNSDMRSYNAKNYQKHRLARYKITPEQHSKMMMKQKGVCAICEELPKGKRPLVVDHCHNTKVVRGLLCYGCNRAISILDKPNLLKKANEYLSK